MGSVNYLGMRDNATSCLARIFMAHTDSVKVPMEEVIDGVLTGLPLRDDFLENNVTWAAVVKLVSLAPQRAALVAPRLARVLALFADASARPELENTPARAFMVRTCRSLLATPPACTSVAKLQEVVRGWSEARQAAFNKALATDATTK